MIVDFSGLDPADVLVELSECTNCQGRSFLGYTKVPTYVDAQAHLADDKNVDYFYGKPIKVDFSTFPKLESRLYDRDSIITMEKISKRMKEANNSSNNS